MTELRQIGHNTLSELPVLNDWRNPEGAAELRWSESHGGASPAEWQAAQQRLAEIDREEALLADYHGEPPDPGVDTRKLLPQQARLARFKAWLDRTEAEAAALEEERGRLDGLVNAPARTQSRIGDLIKRGARALLGRADVGEAEVAERQALDVQLSAEKHRAEAAAAAIAELDQQIAVKRKQLVWLRERADFDFLRPGVLEQADQMRNAYVDAVKNLRGVLVEIGAIRAAAGGAGLQQVLLPDYWPRRVEHNESFGDSVRSVLQPGQAAVSWVDSEQFQIAHSESREAAGKKWADDLLANPFTTVKPAN